ncbi:MAG: tRNA preQ1(34) S-adenosylmethionine ribosyltransferase-isomerase QueA [Chitinispirillaceae bacterium]|nr:tRNA preQ1(34) S-adenosylmethionine ribosyltransferase-isomerase QueA [Chitinispirillaceae bacterium]
MDIKVFDYLLPQNLIAQQPLEERDKCRLLVMSKNDGKIEHKLFKDIKEYLKKGDLLVLNNTKVIPARLYVKKKTGGKVELFFLEKLNETQWKAMVKPGRGVKNGTILFLENSPDITLKIDEILLTGERIVSLSSSISIYKSIESLLESFGHTPLPPYIKRSDTKDDREKYQTVYASVPGAVAAPTAGLHFTLELIEELKSKGVDFTYITLHVGAGTFQPVKTETIEKHKMHYEKFIISQETAEKIEHTKAKGGRVVAVGTTVVRTLEACFKLNKRIIPMEGQTDLFIYPPYQFGVIDALITNFHLPKSTLLMLVCAFGGIENVMKAYTTAVKESYRFFSYGDAMFIY